MPATNTAHVLPALETLIKSHIRDIPDFPKPGIIFKDITPMFANQRLMHDVIGVWCAHFRAHPVEAIVAVESRGFLFGAPLAYELGIPLYLARKQGKLPGETIAQSYSLEYGTATIEMHAGVIHKGERVVLIDDLLATGGTIAAVAKLVERQGGTVAECAFLVELEFLRGRAALTGYTINAMVKY